ncbi:histidine kinase [Nocardia thraciensis]
MRVGDTTALGLDGVATEPGPAVLVPLRTPDAALGVLVAARSAETGAYSCEILEQTTAFTGQVALAMQLSAEQRRLGLLGVLSGRSRIARDLHDLVMHQLFAIGLSLRGTLACTPVRNNGFRTSSTSCTGSSRRSVTRSPTSAVWMVFGAPITTGGVTVVCAATYRPRIPYVPASVGRDMLD